MASPLGHSLVSCYFLRPHARLSKSAGPSLASALFLTVLASLPDLDFFLGEPAGAMGGPFHRTFTHSFFFAAWMGCVIALAESSARGGPLVKRAAFYGAVIATHPLLDFFSVLPPYLGAMPLFWPFSGDFHASPIALLPSAMTYNSFSPVKESYLRNFAAEGTLILPLFAYEAAAAWKDSRAARTAGTSPGIPRAGGVVSKLNRFNQNDADDVRAMIDRDLAGHERLLERLRAAVDRFSVDGELK